MGFINKRTPGSILRFQQITRSYYDLNLVLGHSQNHLAVAGGCEANGLG
jgi:hypothetical protein